jgi:elongation factor G
MVDIKVTLCDGSYHEADSDEGAFETAGFLAMKEAVRQSRPVLMEPVISLKVVVPQQLTNSVVSYLRSRQLDVTGVVGEAQDKVVHAIARLSEVIGFAADLRSTTQERATYSAALLCYRQVQDPPPAGDDHVGVTANKPWKPKPKRGAVAVEPPWQESTH